jgi:hypothetical protein
MSLNHVDLWTHLDTMTDHHGLFEHAKFSSPRTEHGYCTDDNARLLVVASRDHGGDRVERLCRVAFSFCEKSMSPDGRVFNRMDSLGRFIDSPSTDDCWGRCLWGLGVAASHHDDPLLRDTARELFAVGAQQRSPWKRSMAFAALGAAELLASDPSNEVARALLKDSVNTIGSPGSGVWRWPEARLTYANAVLPEALIAAGSALHDTQSFEHGLTMLDWLLEGESPTGQLSVTGCQGRAVSDKRPQFDQQPIEVTTIADACWRAYQFTSDQRWAQGVLLAKEWFDGMNDSKTVMYDTTTGGGYDGLHSHGANLNQGAESTLAFVSTQQRSNALLLTHQ